jgi:hypothetical protein
VSRYSRERKRPSSCWKHLWFRCGALGCFVDGRALLVTGNPERGISPGFFKTSNYESYKNVNPIRVPGTCAWFVEHPIFKKWRESDGNDLLWLTADPGCGKSVLSRALVDERLVGIRSCNPTICHFFFKDNEEQNNIATALCALLHQLR